jgi:membrane-bound lytic murein transglycosylase B
MKSRFALPPLRCFLPLPWKTSGIILALFGITALASAQVNKSIPDPFERLNGEIERTADEQLAQMNQNIAHVPGEFSIRAPISVETPSPAPVSINVSISHDRVDTAEQRLERLGVNAREIFDAAGVPDELLVVAGVESGFDPRALSPKGAVGIWQFMPITARQYGLRVDWQIDDRLNPELETHAAAQYLRDLHLKFGDWLLALAAYNAGEDMVQTAIERNGTTDFWTLRQQQHLPEETRAYVSAVLGVTYATDNRTRRVHWEHPAVLTGKGVELFAQSDSK